MNPKFLLLIIISFSIISCNKDKDLDLFLEEENWSLIGKIGNEQVNWIRNEDGISSQLGSAFKYRYDTTCTNMNSRILSTFMKDSSGLLCKFSSPAIDITKGDEFNELFKTGNKSFGKFSEKFEFKLFLEKIYNTNLHNSTAKLTLHKVEILEFLEEEKRVKTWFTIKGKLYSKDEDEIEIDVKYITEFWGSK